MGAVPPDECEGEYGFDFKRFGVRVPAVLVSPLITAGTVFRVPANSMPLDHTSILKTVEKRWGLPNLTARDAAAPDLGAVLTLSTPRTDDPLLGVTVPQASGTTPAASQPSHLQQVHAQLVAQLPVKDQNGLVRHEMPELKTNADYKAFIHSRTEAWKASKKSAPKPKKQPAKPKKQPGKKVSRPAKKR
jgi:phospholipase C